MHSHYFSLDVPIKKLLKILQRFIEKSLNAKSATRAGRTTFSRKSSAKNICEREVIVCLGIKSWKRALERLLSSGRKIPYDLKPVAWRRGRGRGRKNRAEYCRNTGESRHTRSKRLATKSQGTVRGLDARGFLPKEKEFSEESSRFSSRSRVWAGCSFRGLRWGQSSTGSCQISRTG